MAKQINWIKEEEAARRLGYKPRTLRIYAKAGIVDISYTAIRGRNYHYDEKGIEKILMKDARIVY